MCSDCGAGPLWKNNRSGFCRLCYEKNRPRAIKGTAEHKAAVERSKNYYSQNVEKLRHVPVENRFGLSKEQYNEMLEAQEYRCAICRKHRDEFSKNFAVDHDHSCCPVIKQNKKTCGKCVRSLLCEQCNQGLGKFSDSPELLIIAAQYIKSHRKVVI